MREDRLAHPLLDALMEQYKLKNDAALSRFLGYTPSRVCKIRYGNLPTSDSVILDIHELTDMPIAKIKELAGIK